MNTQTLAELTAQTAEDVHVLREALAAGPTRGPWHHTPHFGEWQIGSEYSVDGEARGTGRQLVAYSPRANKRATPAYAAMFEANGRFIAEASPDRIARLLDAVERERAARQQAQRDLEQARIDRNNARLDVMRETHEQMQQIKRERDAATAAQPKAEAWLHQDGASVLTDRQKREGSFTSGHSIALVRRDALAAATAAQPASFRVSVNPMQTSAGTDYVVCIDHPARPADAKPWDAGRISPYTSQHKDRAELAAQEWREFFDNSGRTLADLIADSIDGPATGATGG